MSTGPSYPREGVPFSREQLTTPTSRPLLGSKVYKTSQRDIYQTWIYKIVSLRYTSLGNPSETFKTLLVLTPIGIRTGDVSSLLTVLETPKIETECL